MAALLCVGGATAASAAATLDAPAATVTILQGDATLIRNALKGASAEGVLLRENDILETSAATRLLRFEVDGGATVDLGPSTRVMLMGQRPKGQPSPTLAVHLLQGWLKWSAPPAAPRTDRLSTPGAEFDGMTRSIVVRVLPDTGTGTPSGLTVFAESGQVHLRTRVGNAADDFSLQSGDFLVAVGAGRPKLLPRPNAEFGRFVKDLPPMLADTLPRRYAAWQGKKVQIGPGEPVTYQDVADWLHADRAETGLRPTFPARWKSRLQDATFKRQMLADLRLHPEWRPLLIVEVPRPHSPSSGAAPRGLVSPR